jgi:hypothetical protein
MNFDLNIGNYSIEELTDMFDLPTNFDKNMVEIKETQLRNNIINNNEINKETKEKTLNFLIQAKNIILTNQTQSDYQNQNLYPYNSQKNDEITSFEKQIEKQNKLLEKTYHHEKISLKSTKISDTSNPLQDRENDHYLSSKPSPYFAGIINPLKIKSQKINLNFDSRFRDNYYGTSASNYIVNLPLTLKNIASINLNAIELPTVYYTISKQYGNNFFTLVVNGKSAVIEIPSGNYNNTSIIQTINNLLIPLTSIDLDFANVVFSNNSTIYTNNTYTGSGQTIVGFNGTQTANATLELNFQADRYGVYDEGTPLPLKLGWILGFRNGVYVENINYVSEGLVDISGPKYFFLVFNDYNNNVNDGFFNVFNSSVLNKNILARITPTSINQSNPYSVNQQNNLLTITTPRLYFGPVNIQSINIQLLDEYGRILDLNNMDFSFCITLDNIYDL